MRSRGSVLAGMAGGYSSAIAIERRDADQVDDLLSLDHLAEQRVLGRQPRVLARDDEELAARRAGILDLRLGHGDDALLVGEVLRRRLDDRVAGAAAPVARRIAALDHEAGHDPVEREPVEEPLVDEVLERAAGLRRTLGVEPDLELAAVRRDGRDVGLRGLERLLGLLDLDVLRRGLLGGLAPRALLSPGVLRGGRLGRRRLRGRRLLVVAAAGERDHGQAGEQEREGPRHGRR
jgi:hypothetical protein